MNIYIYSVAMDDFLSKETQNFLTSVRIVVELLTDILRRVLRHAIPSRSELMEELNITPRPVKFSHSQLRNLLSSDGYASFESPLCYTIIRNYARVVPPTRGWGRPPGDKNMVTLGDDVERIRSLANTFYNYSSTARVSDTEFEKLRDNVSNICQRMDLLFPGEHSFLSLYFIGVSS